MIPSLLRTNAAPVRRDDEADAMLIADLNLDRVLYAMAAGDPLIYRTARRELTQNAGLGIEEIVFRQKILSDCMENADVFFGIYDCLSAHLDAYRDYQKKSLPSFSTFIAATSVLKDTIVLMRILFDGIKKVKEILRGLEPKPLSQGVVDFVSAFSGFFSEDFLSGAYEQMEEIERACDDSYALISAGVGGGLKANQYVLLSIGQSPSKKRNTGGAGRGIALASIGIHAQAGILRDAGLQQISRMLKEVNEKTVACLENIRGDVGFFIGCLRLYHTLRVMGVPVCFPQPLAKGHRKIAFQNLMDGSLALANGHCPVGNAMDIDDFRLVVVTGANQGGKSTFLRSVGCAQLMMQCGMFVCAEFFAAGCCSEVFTHFCHSESLENNHGRFHEELLRINWIVERSDRYALVLMNETFSSTSEHEACLLADEIVQAFYQLGIRTIYVTHFYEFAKSSQEKDITGAHYFAAQRLADGTRRYAIEPASPQRTSYGMDIFRDVFGS